MQRDFRDEILIAVVAVGVIAFAVVFGIILSMVSAPPPEVITLTPATVIADVTNAATETEVATITLSATQHDETSGSATIPTADSPATATDTATSAPTETNTATSTATNTATSAPTETNTATSTATNTATSAPTETNTATATATDTATSAPTETNTATSTATDTATSAPTETNTATATATNTATSAPTETNTATATATDTATSAPTETNTATSTATDTATSAPTETNTATATNTNTATSAPTETNTATATATNTATATATNTATSTPTETHTPTATATETLTPIPTGSVNEDGTCIYPDGFVRYMINAGDTIEDIASDVSEAVENILAANCLAPDTVLITGDVLYLPLNTTATATPDGSETRWNVVGCANPVFAGISSPVAGAVLDSPTSIVGTAFSVSFTGYHLEIRADDEATYTLIRELNVPSIQSALGTIDLTGRESGLYWLRLVVMTGSENIEPDAVCVVPVFAP